MHSRSSGIESHRMYTNASSARWQLQPRRSTTGHNWLWRLFIASEGRTPCNKKADLAIAPQSASRGLAAIPDTPKALPEDADVPGGLAAGERSLRPNNNNEPSQIMWHKLLALFALGMAALASTEAARYIVTCDSSSMDSEGLHSLASNLAANYDTDVLAVYGARLSMHHC